MALAGRDDLHLQGGVLDAVRVAERGPRAKENGLRVRSHPEDEVGGRHLHPRGQGPRVEVVDLRDPGDLFEVTHHRREVDVVRRVLAQDGEDLPAQQERADRDERKDGDGQDAGTDELLAVYETVTAGADAVSEEEIRPWRDRLRRGMESERLRRGGGSS